jgi:predicted helicase
MTIEQYLEKINTRYKTGISTEHTYRGDLQSLLEQMCEDILVTNEPTRIDCGAPDYILTKKNIPIGYIEAKDLGVNIEDKTYKEQFDRYKASLPNLIFTNYVDFHLYREGIFVTSISIGKIENGKVVGIPLKFDEFKNLIQEFSTHTSQTIKSSEKLSKMMAGKAKMLATVIEKALTIDEKEGENKVHEAANNSLHDQYGAFKQILIHDITIKDFADIYAQTIAYGMFAARLHDPSLDTFSRQEAAELIPKTNPFLRKLFQYIAGYDLDVRIKWIVDALADIFRATDVAALLKNFGKSTQQQDPIIHFYETFLAEYDPKLRKARGVWYTPEPVVKFIVRAVDDILKTEFGLKDGLADTSKTKVKLKTLTKSTPDSRSKTKEVEYEEEVHKVQILDPATGTGTFLAEIIKHIHKKFEGQQGIWSRYVDDDLIPRINGFEILMASYAMAHLKLDLLLTETGYKQQKEQRFKVYLTNSLEEHHPDTGTLFANWLSSEANEANHIKRDTPVMVILGNPPYSGESSNKGSWILNLMEDYKKEPGGREKLKEKNSKWINDDYVKFLRYGQHFIEKNGSGILAFINPHGFLDNPTFRGMRWNLLKTYDKIYTIDLHGNAKKKETAPDGTADVNVFDIEQGVSINFFIKTGQKELNALGKMYHYDLFGKREHKYDFLIDNSIKSVPYKEVSTVAPEYVMKQNDFGLKTQYDHGFRLNELFQINGNGIVSKRDSMAFKDKKEDIISVVRDVNSLSTDEIKAKYNDVSWTSRDGKVEFVKQNVTEFGLDTKLFVQCEYRPFDKKWTYYTGKSKGFVGWPVKQIMQHFLNGENVGLVIGRQGQAVGSMQWNLCFITNTITDFNLYYRGGGMAFPLYLYPENTKQQTIENNIQRSPNLNSSVVDKITAALRLKFTKEKEPVNNTFSPIDILDYIYAILHSPSYRNKYKEFLKTDFPSVPYPKEPSTFWKLVKLGGELRQIHLLESNKTEKYITTYPVSGTNMIEKPSYKAGRVLINLEQYFDKVPQVAWDFYIGGYQPAQKWLKDRKGKTLSVEDIFHYQKIIVALTETDRIMKEIDKIDFE